MTSTMAIWAFLGVLSGYLIRVQLRSITRFNRQQEAINRLMFDNSVNKNDIEALHWRTGNLISEHSDLAPKGEERSEK